MNKAAADGRDALMASLNRAMREASGLGALFGATVAARLGLSASDLECIDFIVLRGPITAGELAAASGLTTGAVTGVIDRLERLGYARRTRDSGDRRKVHISALPKVLEVARPYYDPFERAQARLLARYADGELSLLIDYFTRCAALIRGEIERVKAMPGKRQAARKARARSSRP